MTYFTDTMLDILNDQDIPAETARALLASAINPEINPPAGYAPLVNQIRCELQRLENHREKARIRVAKYREERVGTKVGQSVTKTLHGVTQALQPVTSSTISTDTSTDTSKGKDTDKESILPKKLEYRTNVGIKDTFKPPFKGDEAFASACNALTPKLTVLAEMWVQYKAERKEKYTPSGLTQVLKKIVAMGEARTEAAVNFSMESNYAGLFEPNGNNQGRKPSSSLETGNYKEMPF